MSLDRLTEMQKQLTGTQAGVAMLCDYNSGEFEKTYLSVREKEARVLDVNQVSALPNVDPSNPHYKEWKIRQHTAAQVMSYLQRQPVEQADWVLDVGCGNGWFTHLLAKSIKANVVGIDINLTELEQASKAFKRDNLYFAYLDLLRYPPEPHQFSHIFINCCFQYFDNPRVLLDLCLTLLVDGGEVHILDSPFYLPKELQGARNRSKDYYQTLETGEMGRFYHHHDLTLFDEYNVEFLYQPLPRKTRKATDSPFPWLKICQ